MLSVSGQVPRRRTALYRSFNISYALKRGVGHGTGGCANVALDLHRVVAGGRSAGDLRTVAEHVSVGGGSAASTTKIKALAWEYSHQIWNAELATPTWGRIGRGLSYGFTRTYTGPSDDQGSGSFGLSQTATVRFTFKRVG